MHHPASQLLPSASRELDLCHVLLAALDDQREALLARDADRVLRTSRLVETLLDDIARLAAETRDPRPDVCASAERARDRSPILNRALADVARRIRAANDFNQRLVLEALGYQDLMLRLLSGHPDEDTYAAGKPAPRASIPVFLNQSA